MSDVDISDLPVPETDISDLPIPPDKKISGIGTQLGHAGLDVAGGIAHGIGTVADVFTGTDRGPGSYASKLSAPFQHAPDYEPPDVKEQIRSSAPKLGDLPFMKTKEMQGFVGDIGEIGEAAGTIFGAGQLARGGVNAFLREPPAEIPVAPEHPLAAATKAETQRITGFKARADQLGLDLPETGSRDRLAQASSTNTPVVSDIVRNDLQLHPQSPVTPNMLERKGGAFDTYVTPKFNAVRNDPISPTLDDEYAIKQAALLKGTRAKFNPDLTPPIGDKVSGADAVQYSQDARTEARFLYKKAEGPMGTTTDLKQADLYKQSAENLEDAIARHYERNGQPQVGADWTAARNYAAKANDYIDAMDGAGNVNPAVLSKKLLRQGKPLSGDQEMLAEMGARYPEALKITRETAPSRPGFIRRGVAGAAPVIGAGIGGAMGPWGAAGGAAIGESVGQRILNR